MSSKNNIAAQEYERGYDDALLHIGRLIGWNALTIEHNQGGGWLSENDGLGTAPITGERVRALYEEKREEMRALGIA